MSPQSHLISVIMPVHNAGAYLEAAVESILNQKNVTFEFILVDDHSTDHAIVNLNKKFVEDKRLKIISSDERGVVAAMQKGFEYATGEYIARMDADDISLPQRLSEQLNYLMKHPEIGVAGAQVKIISDFAIANGFVLYEKWLNNLCSPIEIEREIFIESPIPNPTAFFRREIYEKLNGYHDPVWAEDYDLWLRAHAMGIKMGKPKGVLLHWREHNKRLTHCDERYNNKLFMQAKAHYLSRSHHLKNRKAIIWGAGPTGSYLYDVLLEQNIDVGVFLDVDPRLIGRTKKGIPVLHFKELNNYIEEQEFAVLILGAVGARGARDKIREALLGMGKEEGTDFLFAA